MGDYKFAESPDEPVIIHLERFPHVNNQGLSAREQRRAGRRELLSTSFEEIERETRQQLFGMLGAHGFDPATDITAITVNRWGHGYAYSYNELFDDVYENWNDERMPHMRAKKPFGNITIANSDAAAIALFYCAVEEAHRAVEELPA
jgi:spermidine dehydrogenase